MALRTLYTETFDTRCGVALQLVDAFSRLPRLEGAVTVKIANMRPPAVRPGEATFVFLDLANGAYQVQVASAPETPYYLPVAIPVTVPMTSPLWPAFPDLAIADRTLPLDDAAQPAAYRTQRALATLHPAVGYPFPPDATLVRGSVTAGGQPLQGATVSQVGSTVLPYTTGPAGEFVIFFSRPQGMAQNVTLRASHPAKPPVDAAVTVKRGSTATANFVMAP
jgi:hypothetical protein